MLLVCLTDDICSAFYPMHINILGLATGRSQNSIRQVQLLIRQKNEILQGQLGHMTRGCRTDGISSVSFPKHILQSGTTFPRKGR
jgi:hypothetical protein